METEYLQLLTALYESMYEGLYQRTMAKYQDSDFAEEVVQEAFAIACTKVQQLFEHPCPEGWISVTVRHVAERKYRKRDHHLILLDSAALPDGCSLNDPVDLLDPDVLYADLAETKEYKMIRELVDQQLSIHEAAEKKGINQGTYKMRIARAKRILQNKLQKTKNNVTK